MALESSEFTIGQISSVIRPHRYKLGLLIGCQVIILLIGTSKLRGRRAVGHNKEATEQTVSGSLSSMMSDPHAGHNMGNGDDSGTDHTGMDHSGMMMHFHISETSTILFKGWQTHNWQTMLGSCVAVFIMATLYEGLKVARELLLKKYSSAGLMETRNANGKQHMVIPTSDNGMCGGGEPVRVNVSVGTRMCSISHLIQTLLHILQVVLSYFLMLIFMTYNFYLCVAVACGAGLGYFLFSWKRSTIIDVNEHCH